MLQFRLHTECRSPNQNATTNKSIFSTNQKPRILCYINTYPENYDSKAVHAQATWARRCDEFFFTSTEEHKYLRILKLNMTVPETKKHLWMKMRTILRHLYTLVDKFDYFYKADDDSYALIDHLRHHLRKYSPSVPFMTGFRWPVMLPGGFFSGGSGYVLSREALKRIVEQAIDQHPKCPTIDEDMEDVKMSICGQAVGVNRIDSYDESAKPLFYPWSILRGMRDFIRETGRSLHKQRGFQVDLDVPVEFYSDDFPFSNEQISFHYMTNHMMYILEFCVYYTNRVIRNSSIAPFKL